VCSVLILIGFVASPSGNLFVFSVPDRSMALFTLWPSLWGGKLFAQRIFELERTQAILGQEAEQRARAESKMRGLAAIVESSTDPIMNIKTACWSRGIPQPSECSGTRQKKFSGNRSIDSCRLTVLAKSKQLSLRR
jgi:hypothetical protein